MNLAGFGTTEMMLILVLVIFLFGLGRISRLGSELGSAISEFRKGIKHEDSEQVSNELKS